MNQFQCEICGKKDALTFHCNYCGSYFCAEHHLPESHNCTYKPRTTPFHVRPSEVESDEASSEPQEPSAINYPSTHQHSKTKSWKKIAWVLPVVIIISLLFLAMAYSPNFQKLSSSTSPSPTPTATPTPIQTSTPSSTPTSSLTPSLSPASSHTATPTLTSTPVPTPTGSVEVDYQTVGWFYQSYVQNPDFADQGSDGNFTYLVLKVTITNTYNQQVNVTGVNGFSVIIDGNTYQAVQLPSTTLSLLSPYYYEGNVLTPIFYNTTNINNSFGLEYVYETFSYSSAIPPTLLPMPYYNIPTSACMPSQWTLLKNGSVSGLIVFQFGQANVSPPQPQILNQPFTLQYSVAYATVVVNQK